jgi:pectin lyase
VKTPVQDNTAALYAPTSDDSACQSAIGRACVANSFSGSGALAGTDSSVLSQIGSNAVDAVAASEISGIPGTAGNTL